MLVGKTLLPLVSNEIQVSYIFQVFSMNMLAAAMFPLWAYLGYSAYNLKSDLDPFNENVSKPNFGLLMNQVQKASVGVAVGFFLFGEKRRDCLWHCLCH